MQIKHVRTIIFSFLLLFTMLFLTGLAYNYIRKNIQQQGRAKFESQSQSIANAINVRFNRDIYFLYSLKGLYAASKSVERNEFKAYSDGAQIAENFPGIYAVEFIQKVSAQDKEAFVESVKSDTSISADGYPEFKIYPEENKDTHLILKYFYPEENGISSLGFDFSTEENRSAAMEEALKNDRPAITERVQIIGTDKTGFIIFLPVYKNGMPIATEAERRENLDGFVEVVIEVEKFFNSVIQAEKIDWNNFDMYAYDQIPDSQYNSEDYLFDADNDKEEGKDDKAEWSYAYDLPLNIADKTWTLHFVANPDYGINNLEFAMMGFLILSGVIFSFFLSGTFYFMGTSRRRALILAEKMTQKLRDNEERFRALFAESKDAMMTTIPEKGFISGNRAAIELFGCRDEKDFISRSPADLSPQFQPDGTKSSDKSQKMMKLALEKGSNSFEWMHKKVDGTEFLASVLLSRVEGDNKPYLQATVRDITAQKKAEEKLKNQAIEMERINKLMTGRELKMIELKKEIDELKKQK